MDWGTLLNSSLAVMLLVTAGYVGLERARKGSIKADLEENRARVEDLRGDLVEERASHAEDRTTFEREIAKLRSEIQALEIRLAYAERLATGENHWENLDASLQALHADAKGVWVRNESKLSLIETMTRKIADLLEGRKRE